MLWELIGLYFITKSTCLWDEDFKRTIFPQLVKTTKHKQLIHTTVLQLPTNANIQLKMGRWFNQSNNWSNKTGIGQKTKING